jgi:hypothetical protein
MYDVRFTMYDVRFTMYDVRFVLNNRKSYIVNRTSFVVLLFLASFFIACRQEDPTKVSLDDYAVPNFKYGRPPNYMDWRKQFGTSYSSDMARKLAYARIRALRSGNFREDNKGIRVGVFDANQNGVYNEPGVDYFVVAPFAADTLPMFDGVASPLQPATPFYVQMGRDQYQIDSIAENGKTIWLQPKERADSIAAFFATQAPLIDILTVAGDTIPLNDFFKPGKYLYVECWSTWFQAAIDGLPELKAAYTRFKEDIEVLHLVMNEVDYQRVEKHVARYEMPWTQAIFTDEIGRQLMQNSIPYGILFAPDGSIIKMGLGPGDLEPFLEEIL